MHVYKIVDVLNETVTEDMRGTMNISHQCPRCLTWSVDEILGTDTANGYVQHLICKQSELEGNHRACMECLHVYEISERLTIALLIYEGKYDGYLAAS